MRRRKMSRPFRRFLIVVGILLAAIALWSLLGSVIRSWHVEREIADFAKRPSQAGADTLVGLLQHHAATTEQGQHILAALRRPQVTARRAYAVGRPAFIIVERPFELDFKDTLWREETIWLEGGGSQRRVGQGKDKPETTYLRAPPGDPLEPGTQRLTLRCKYTVQLQRRGGLATVGRYIRDLHPWAERLLSGRWQPARTYECEFAVPMEIQVATSDKADQIQLSSDPELDEAMRAAFSVRSSFLLTAYVTAQGEQRFDKLKAVFYNNLPSAIAFTVAIQLPDGREIRPQPEYWRPFRAHARTSGQFILNPEEFAIEEPGQYQGTLVLTPDPNLAYEDPEIDAIWNGTLKLPISFTVREKLAQNR